MKQLATKLGLSANSIDAAQASLKMLAGAYIQYKEIASQEKTKRVEIRARRDEQLAQTEKERHILELYLSSVFKERANSIEGFFQTLDKAIERKDDHLIEQSIGAILAIAKQSPLAEAREIAAAMNNPEVRVIDI